MSPQVAVPCPHCAVEQAVEFRRAGQELACAACGKRFTAPKLRELKQLLPAPLQATARGASKAGQTPLRNWLFVIGLATAALCGIGGYLVTQYAKTMIVDEALAKRFTLDVEQDLDSYAPADLWVTWETMLANRVLPQWDLAASRDVQQLGESLRLTGWGLFGLAGLGVLTLLGSFFLAGPAQSPARR
jgi:hypothetical protein